MVPAMRTAVLVSVLVAAAPAHAEKSEKVSVGLAAAGTGVSSALVLSAFLVDAQNAEVNMPLLLAGLGSSVVTPSLGHLYSEQWLTIGMAIRGAAGALVLYGVSSKQDQPCITRPTENCPEITSTGLTLISIAAIAYIGGVAFDVRDSRDAARRYNRRHTNTTATLGPTLMPHGGGLAILGRF